MVLRKAGLSLTLEGKASYLSGLKDINREQRLLAEQSKLAIAQLGTNASKQATYATTMDSYAKRLDVATQKTNTFKTRQAELPKIQDTIKSSMTQLNKTYQDSATRTEELKKKYDALKTSKDKDKQAISDARDAYKSSKAETKSLGDEVKNLERAYDSNNKELKDLPFNLAKAETATQKLRNEMQLLHTEYRNAGGRYADVAQNLKDLGGSLTKTGDTMKTLGGTATKYITAPLLLGGATAIKAAISYESAFAGVKKTVDEVYDANGNLVISYDQLSDGIRNMAKELPSSASEIANVAETAGQLGIKTEDVLSFTRTMIDMGESTNLSANDAATAIAKIANITGMTSDEYAKFGSAVVALGNNFATTESDVVQMTNRLASAGKLAGLTNPQILGLATAMSSVGIEAEAGGTAMTQTLTAMESAAVKGVGAFDNLSATAGNFGYSIDDVRNALNAGGSQLTKFAKSMGMSATDLKKMYNEADKASATLKQFADISGMSATQFADTWKKDPIVAIESFIKGLGNLDKQGESATQVLDDMGLSGIRQSNMLKSLALASDTLTGAVDMSTKAWGENTALTDEANKRYETTESKLKMLKNEVVDVGIEMGGPLVDALRDAVESAKPLIQGAGDLAKQFSELDKGTQQTIIKWVALAAAGGPVLSMLGNVTSGFGSLSKGLGNVVQLYGKLTTPKNVVSALESVGTGAFGASGKVAGFASVLGGMPVVLGIATAALVGWTAWEIWGEKAWNATQRAMEWGSEIDSVTTEALEDFQTYSGDLELALDASSGALKDHTTEITDSFTGIVDVVSRQVQNANKKIDEQISGLPDSVRAMLAETLEEEKQKNNEREANAKQLQANITQIMTEASNERRELTDEELYYIKLAQEEIAQDLAETVSGDTKKIFENLTADLDTLDKKSINQRRKNAKDAVDDLNETYKENSANLKEMYNEGKISGTDYHKAMKELNDEYKESLNQGLAAYYELMEAQGYDESTMKRNIELMGGDYEKLMEYMEQVAHRGAEMHGILIEGSAKAGEWAVSANEKWNELAKDPATGLVRENIQSVVKAAKESEETWNNLEFAVQYGELDTNTKQQIMVASIAEGTWNDLSFDTQQALIMDNFGYFGKELLVASDKWDGLDLAVQDAILNTNSSETLQKALQDVGLWDQMSFEEHMAIVATNADKMIIEAMQANGTWDGLSYEQKEAVLNSNVSQAQIDFLNTNDLWNNQEFMEKVADIMTNSPEKEKDIQNLIDTWSGVPKKETKEVNTETNALETTEKLNDLAKQSQPGNYGKPDVPTKTNAPLTTDMLDKLSQSTKPGNFGKPSVPTSTNANETKGRINTLNAESKKRMGRPKVDTWTNADTTRGRVNTLASAVNAVPTSKHITFTTSRYENTYRTVKDIMYSGPTRLQAKGTNFHPGGNMIVNDQKGPLFREYVKFPNEPGFIPEGRDVFIPNAPRGTKVLKASLTKNMFPHYKDGIGVDYNLLNDKSLNSDLIGLMKNMLNRVEAVRGDVVVNNRGLLDGAVFQVREESDIKKIAKAIVDYNESLNPNRYPTGRRA